jgi:DNA-binding CsgD family transcriptional regulator/tetratricopeptide (TPR) repeat protein
MQLIEREDHLATLSEYLGDAVAGSGRIVLLGGEAGVGKSALVARFVEDAKVRVATGACDGLATPRPLAPVLEIAEQLGLQPTTRDELFGAVLDALKQEPTIVVVEDIHWADGVTRDFLLYLGRRLGTLPVLAIVSYRDDEGGANDPLRTMLGEASRFAAARRVGLPRFSPQGVGALIEGSGLDAAEVHRLTGGNPYFVMEVVASGSLAPTTVRDAVVSRASALSRPARRALEVASQLGARFDPMLLADASEADAEGVDECLERRLLHTDGDQIGFSHEIARAAIESEIQPVRRIAIHRAILGALENRGDADVPTLAHHAAGAGDGDAVIRYALDAAEQASTMGAHTEARTHLRIALRFAARLDDEARARLLDDLSWECQLTDQMDEAIRARTEALEIWERLEATIGVGVDHRSLSRLYWYKALNEDAVRHAERAIEVLETVPAGAELARAYGEMSGIYMLRQYIEKAIEYGKKAIALGEQTGSGEVVAHALNNVGSAIGCLRDYQEGLAMLERSLALSLEGGWPDHVARAYINIASVAGNRLDLARAERHINEGIAYADDHDLVAHGICLMGARADMALLRGRWDDALADADSLMSRSQTKQISQSCALYTKAAVAVRRGANDARALAVDAFELLSGSDELQRRVPIASVIAEEAWLRGDADGVRDAIALVWDEVVQRGSPSDVGILGSWLARVGALDTRPPAIVHPYDLQIDGRWAEAAEAWRRIDAPYETACALVETGDPSALTEAFETFDGLGAEPAAALVAGRLRALGERVPRGPRTSTRDHPAGLTAREDEILALVADGMTNAEIASALFISEKTVEHHVSRVLMKLDAPTRREAARAAQRLGLALQT